MVSAPSAQIDPPAGIPSFVDERRRLGI